jgi:hypothetical protein
MPPLQGHLANISFCIQIIHNKLMEGHKYGKDQLGNIYRNVHCMDVSVRDYLEMGETGPIEWTLA